jgi:ATP-binding cassette subfamily B protein
MPPCSICKRPSIASPLMPKALRSLGFIVATSFRADPWRAAAVCALTPTSALGTVGAGLSLKLLADAAAGGRPGVALGAAGALAAITGLSSVARLVLARLRFRLQERVGLLLERRLVELAAGLPRLEHLALPEYLDRLEYLRAERSALSQAIGTVVMSGSVALQVLSTGMLLASVHPWLLALPLFGLPTLGATARSAVLTDAAKAATAYEARLSRKYLDLAGSVGPAKELRLYGLGEEMLARHQALGESAVRTRVRARLAGAAWAAGGSLVFVTGYVGAIAFVIRQATLGLATPGDILLALQLAGQTNGAIGAVAGAVAALREVSLIAGHYLWFVDYARGAFRRNRSRPRVAAPRRLETGISLEDVSFRYPGTSADVLADVNLYLPAGAVVALVGENGAGKSTLVNLLCGFYQPTRGRIAIDGVDLGDMDPEAWRAGLSGAFQDFCKFELTAQEAIGVGDLPEIDDEVRVLSVAEEAGASAVIDSLPDGLATQLGPTFEGVDLSQGQWQKLALARSRMRPAPLLFILDEPTASLDARSEQELFSRIISSARRAADRGAITLLVSHRLSTVRDADMIVVLREGRVVEAGTHSALMEEPGLYAELFTLQSRAYQ